MPGNAAVTTVPLDWEQLWQVYGSGSYHIIISVVISLIVCLYMYVALRCKLIR